MDFYHPSLNDVARKIPPDHVWFLFVLLDNAIRLSKGQLRKPLCPLRECHLISMHIKSITQLCVLQNTRW